MRPSTDDVFGQTNVITQIIRTCLVSGVSGIELLQLKWLPNDSCCCSYCSSFQPFAAVWLRPSSVTFKNQSLTASWLSHPETHQDHHPRSLDPRGKTHDGCHRTIAAQSVTKRSWKKPPKRSLKPDPKNNIWKTSGVIYIYIYGFPLVHIQHRSFKVMSQCL